MGPRRDEKARGTGAGRVSQGEEVSFRCGEEVPGAEGKGGVGGARPQPRGEKGHLTEVDRARGGGQGEMDETGEGGAGEGEISVLGECVESSL